MSAALLKAIADVPAGQKLPLSRFARDLNCSVSVVSTMVEQLIKAGKIDRETLRPPVEVDRDSFDAWLFVGATSMAVGEAVKAEARKRGVTLTETSLAIFGNKTQLSSMSSQSSRLGEKVVGKVRAWLTGAPLPQATEQGRAAVPVARNEEVGAVRSDLSAPTVRDGISGKELAEAIKAAQLASGIPMSRFLQPLWRNTMTGFHQLEQTRRPKKATVERVRAFLSGNPMPLTTRKAFPQQLMRRDEREAAGIPPSQRELDERKKIEVDRQAREAEEWRREAADLAQNSRRPGETLAEAVKRECDDLAARRLRARVAGGGIRPVDLDEDDDDIGQLTADRREREMRDVTTPSALIRRAHAEWPDKCAKVSVLACQMGLKVGEVWDQVIGAGILALQDDLREEGTQS